MMNPSHHKTVIFEFKMAEAVDQKSMDRRQQLEIWRQQKMMTGSKQMSLRSTSMSSVSSGSCSPVAAETMKKGYENRASLHNSVVNTFESSSNNQIQSVKRARQEPSTSLPSDRTAHKHSRTQRNDMSSEIKHSFEVENEIPDIPNQKIKINPARNSFNALRQKSSSSIGDRSVTRNLSLSRQSMSSAFAKSSRDSSASSKASAKANAAQRALRSRWGAALALAEQRIRDGGPSEPGRKALKDAEAALPNGAVRELASFWILTARIELAEGRTAGFIAALAGAAEAGAEPIAHVNAALEAFVAEIGRAHV